jgi:DNA-binding SARP family transcriptional activator
VAAQLQLFGGLRLALEGHELALPSSRKARLLLAMLALDRRVHGRSELAGRLWPDVREDSARVSLRTALVQLRAALGETADAVLHAGRDGGVALLPEVRTDVEELEELLAAGEPEAALERYRGELLAGFDEDWVHERRDDLRASLAAGFGAAAAAAEAADELEAAVRLTRRQTGLDPLAEAPHRDLIRRLAAADDCGAALTAYDRLRERLADQLRVAPSASTRRLIDEIRADRSRDLRAAVQPAATQRLSDLQGGLDGGGRAVVGRVAERTELLRLLDPQGPMVSFVYGLAGVGKSALLRAFAADAAARDAVVLTLHAEAGEPTEAGFMAALARALGADVTDAIMAGEAIGAAGRRVVVTLDAYERLGPLDDWVRDMWLPALPDHVRLAIAGRTPPAPGWSARYGPLFAAFGLDSLSPSDAIELLRRLGVPAERAVHVNRVLRGHPLALQLVASTPSNVRGAGDSSLRLAIEELAKLFLTGLEGETRQALDAASVVRRVTVSLLTAMLPEAAAADVLDRLRRLPFVWAGSEGLIVFHVVRSVVAAQLRSEDPARYRRLRTAAWQQLRRELRRAPRSELWRYGVDLLYLSDSPAIRDAFFPNTMPFYELARARPEDHRAIEEIARRHEPSASVRLVRTWSRAAPETLTIAHAQDNAVAGYSTVCEIGSLSRRPLQRDPIAATWRTHQRAHPLPDGSRVLCARHLLTAAGGEAASPAQAALWLDLIRRCLELQPELRRIYTCVRNPADAAARLEPLGFRALDEPPTRLDNTPYYSYVLDLGSGSAQGWLAELAGLDLGIDESTGLLHTDVRDVMLDGEPVSGGALDPSPAQGPSGRGDAKTASAAFATRTSAP